MLRGDLSIYLGPLCLRRDAVPFQFGHRRVASPFRLGHFCPHRVGPSLVLLAPGNIPAEILALGKVHPCQHGGEIWFTCHPLENCGVPFTDTVYGSGSRPASQARARSAATRMIK